MREVTASWARRTQRQAKRLRRLSLALGGAAGARLAEAISLAQAFAELLRNRCPEQLDAWLARAADSSLAPFRGFAEGVQADYDAVKAGVTPPWSNGPVEGHINRLKMIKRSMYGRAKLDLLDQRFRLAA